MSKTNHVRLIGNLGGSPKLISTQEGQSVLSFTMATHETYKDQQGNKQSKTDWHNIVAFGKVANLIHDYLKKGSQAMIIGKLQTRQYVDKQQNQRYVTEVIVEEVLFLGDAKSE
jgi:single-strand DNA-binding protein